MNLSLPSQPLKLNLCNTDISFVRDGGDGYILATIGANQEKLSIPQWQILVRALSALGTLASESVHIDAINNP